MSRLRGKEERDIPFCLFYVCLLFQFIPLSIDAATSDLKGHYSGVKMWACIKLEVNRLGCLATDGKA